MWIQQAATQIADKVSRETGVWISETQIETIIREAFVAEHPADRNGVVWDDLGGGASRPISQPQTATPEQE